MSNTKSVRFRLLAAFGLAAAMTLIATVVGVTGFNSVNTATVAIGEEAIPELKAIDRVSENSVGLRGELAAFSRSNTVEDRVSAYDRAQELDSALQEGLSELEDRVGADAVAPLRAASGELTSTIDAMNEAVTLRLQNRDRFNYAIHQAREARTTLTDSVEGALDASDDADVETLLRIAKDANFAAAMFAEVATAASDAEVDAVFDEFDFAAGELEVNLMFLPDDVGAEVEAPINAIVGFGQGSQGVFELRKSELAAMAEAEAVSARTTAAVTTLLAEVEDFKGYVEGNVDAAMGSAFGAVGTGRVLLIAIAAAGLLIAAGIGFFYVHRMLLFRIGSMARTMSALAEGDAEMELGFEPADDEIGDMARSVEVFRANEVERRCLEAQSAEERAQKEQRSAKVEELIADFEMAANDALGQVSEAAQRMEGAARTMSSTAASTSGKSAAVAQASEGASQNVQTVAAAAEEMVSSIGEISQQIVRSTDIAGNAVDQVERTNEDVQQLDDAAKKIDDIVSLINDIAEQTNLLALNATIEAARAGEAGKGFAVVAAEVKALASQTAGATQSISEQISGIQNATGKAVDAMGSIGGTIHEMSEIATAIAAAMEEQRAAAAEITRSAQDAADGTNDVFQNIQSVDAATAETGESAGEVLEASLAVSRQSDSLSGQVKDFLVQVRSA
jgi:methyl-accepting chemotaxis protein